VVQVSRRKKEEDGGGAITNREVLSGGELGNRDRDRGCWTAGHDELQNASTLYCLLFRFLVFGLWSVYSEFFETYYCLPIF